MNQNKEEPTYIYKWNPWIGCHQKSTGCQNCSSAQDFPCYYQTIQLDLGNFDLPLQRNKKGQYYIPQHSNIALEFNGDFFIEDMDFFRPYLWNIIKARSDCLFITSTKRPERIKKCLPKDWNQGWKNIIIGCTAETQELVEERLPIYLSIPMKKYQVLTQPFIQAINLTKYLPKIDAVIAEGEYINKEQLYPLVRPCDYKWVKDLQEQCIKFNVDFIFTLSGTLWINENGVLELISPQGWDMKDRIQEYNFNTGNLFGFNTNNYQFIGINKEEN